MKKIVFNVSLPRSGSTLLQNILAQNPRFYATPTSGLFDLLAASREQFTRIPEVQAQDRDAMRKAFLGYCQGALQGFFTDLTERPVCVDKSRGWLGEYDWLNGFHPKPRILVPVRDLRAILSSMEKRWHALPHLHKLELSADPSGIKMATVQNRVAHWLNTAPVGSNVTKLMGAVERGIHKQFHIVRFEDLTTRPQDVLNAIYDYLEEPRFTHDFSNVAQTTKENDALYPVYGDHKIRQEVKPVALDYHDVLGKALSNTIKQDNGAYYSAFYPDR
jgi:sulfotransferase